MFQGDWPEHEWKEENGRGDRLESEQFDVGIYGLKKLQGKVGIDFAKRNQCEGKRKNSDYGVTCYATAIAVAVRSVGIRSRSHDSVAGEEVLIPGTNRREKRSCRRTGWAGAPVLKPTGHRCEEAVDHLPAWLVTSWG